MANTHRTVARHDARHARPRGAARRSTSACSSPSWCCTVAHRGGRPHGLRRAEHAGGPGHRGHQGRLVILFFMHVKYSPRLVGLAGGGRVLLAGSILLLRAPALDYLTRSRPWNAAAQTQPGRRPCDELAMTDDRQSAHRGVPAPPLRRRRPRAAARWRSWRRQRQFPIVGPLVGRHARPCSRAPSARGASSSWAPATATPRCTSRGRWARAARCTARSCPRRTCGWREGFLAPRGRVGPRHATTARRRRPRCARVGGTWDIVYNDIDKDGYPDTVDLAYAHLRPGGLFITRQRALVGPRARRARTTAPPATRGVREFTRRLLRAPRLPDRDRSHARRRGGRAQGAGRALSFRVAATE